MEFNATGFNENSHFGIIIEKENTLSANSTSTNPFTGIHNDMTDLLGIISGEFNIDTTKGHYDGYHLKIYLDNNRYDMQDSPSQFATSPISC